VLLQSNVAFSYSLRRVRDCGGIQIFICIFLRISPPHQPYCDCIRFPSIVGACLPQLFVKVLCCNRRHLNFFEGGSKRSYHVLRKRKEECSSFAQILFLIWIPQHNIPPIFKHLIECASKHGPFFVPCIRALPRID